LVLITEVESVYSAVRTESLYKTDTFRLSRVNDAEASSSATRQSVGLIIMVDLTDTGCDDEMWLGRTCTSDVEPSDFVARNYYKTVRRVSGK
jgi:hypothetical protein